jgi:hypothetical protein
MSNSAVSSVASAPNPLRDARALQARIAGLRSLLHVQLRQIEAISERIQPSTPAGRAASRLLTLKEAGRSRP